MAEDNPSVVGAAARLGNALITTLPPAFLMLVLINTVFIVALLYFETHAMDSKLAILNRVLDACMHGELAPKAAHELR